MINKRSLKFVAIALIMCSFFLSCAEIEEEKVDNVVEVVRNDFKELLERGTLNLLTENSSTSYFLYKGNPMGYDYELVHQFCDDHDLDLNVIIIEDLNQMFDMLEKGEGDLIACNLTVTKDRMEHASFTDPFFNTKQVLVQRKPDDWWKLSRRTLEDSLLRDLTLLDGVDIGVHEYSSFNKRLKNLEEEMAIDINIIEMSGTIDSEELIKMVLNGELKYTIADENVAQLNATYYSQLDVETEISLPQKIAWAVNKESDSLLLVLNTWMNQKENKNLRAHIDAKYFKFKKNLKSKVTSEYSSLEGGKISKYDDYLKDKVDDLDWDWKMLAAMIKKESNFNPEAVSWAGAYGLMQLMPETSVSLGGDTTDLMYGNIDTGVKYLKRLDKYWLERIDDPEERVKFVLASYNAGLGHVLDAQILAANSGKDSTLWNGNVEDGMLMKSKKEFYTSEEIDFGYCRGDDVVHYVKDIMGFYEHFSKIPNEIN